VRDKVLFLLAFVSLVAVRAAASAHATETIEWRSGLTEISQGWATHAGDNALWAQPNFDDGDWAQVDMEDLGPPQTGWRWFRKHISTGADLQEVRLLVSGGDGTFALFVNGVRLEGPQIRSAFNVRRPTERVFELSDPRGDFAIAFRTHTPANYAAYHLPLFLSVTLGRPTAIEYERQALESQRVYALLPSMAINFLLCAAGLVGLALYRSQRGQREYLFLGLYLLTVGISNGLWIPQQEGLLPTSANSWIADPLIFAFTILQIEFTFSFARIRPGRAWRVYEAALLAPVLLIPAVWTGHFSFDVYALIEALAILPAGLLLPAALFIWYRRGNREAGWLILPSLLPTVTLFLFDLGGALSSLGWVQFGILLEPVPLGPAQFQIGDLGNAALLFAMVVVMFFRFTRVSREQARSAAELNAAREIQQRLVPASVPAVPGFTLEAAYVPAQEVGGDFYQVLAQSDGSTLVVVGDVSGKGLKAAMTGALAIGAIRTLSLECLRPGRFLSRLNQQLIQSSESGFVTCLCARIVAGGEIAFANAGHLAPYADGREVPVDGGLPLGIAAEADYPETRLDLAPGVQLTLMTDGVVEARSKSGELFGFERTASAASLPAGEIAKRAQHFGQEDDITVLTLCRAEPAAAGQASLSAHARLTGDRAR
jgi:hypothetical protein